MKTTMMKTTTMRLALATALLTTCAMGANAETKPDPAKTTSVEVRVINNYIAPVRVFVKDGSGRTHDMGWVGRSNLRIVEISEAIADRGAFQIHVVPDEPLWSRLNNDEGIRTNGLTPATGETLNFWVEPNLSDSQVEVVRG